MVRLNLPSVERFIRVALGLGVAVYAWVALAQPNPVFIAIGFCLAMTGLIGFCPVCAVAGRRLEPKP